MKTIPIGSPPIVVKVEDSIDQTENVFSVLHYDNSLQKSLFDF